MLMVAQGEVGKERGLLLNLMNVFKRGGKAPTPAELKKRGADVTKQLMAEAQQFRDSLKEISEKQPEMLGPVLLAYESLDGSVRGMDALNNYFRQSTGVISKAFIDGQPEIPSLVMQGFWSTVYNNVLSAIGTPIRAAMSAAALLIERPMATFVGAIGQPGMMRQMRRGWYQYAALMETMNKGRKYFAETMRRSGADPTYQGVLGRENFIRNNEKQLEVLNAFADAKAAQGEYGPQAMMAQIAEIEALAQSPFMRMGSRLMQATDGFTQAVIANVEARGRAFDMVNVGQIDADAMDTVAKNVYEQMFKADSKGRAIISDKAVKHAAGEIAMNLDSQASNGLSD